MKGDFSRLTFRPKRRYSSVRLQQGRVQLDADWNEQVDIQTYQAATTATDVIGRWGAPMDQAGFAITATGPTLTIGKGHYYVAGTLCENDVDQLDVIAQPDAPGTTLPTAGGFYLVYLDVWQRHLTALERPDIREIALGGPDTATRTRTTWQVKFLQLPDPVDGVVTTQDYRDFDQFTTGTPGQLRAQAEPVVEAANECLVPPGAGYRRLENQLYRIEVHTGSTGAGAPTFKWSRDNGTLLANLTDIAGLVVTVADLGRDDVLSLAAAKWIEVSDEERTLRGEPGVLLEVDVAQANAITIKAWPDGTQLAITDFGTKPTVRRWDEAGFQLQANQMRELEDGVQVEFDGGVVRTGDYWLIPARSLTGTVEWPRDTSGPLFEAPHGIHHDYAPLAVLRHDDGVWLAQHDVRRRFPPTTKLTGLFYVGGDGQTAAPGATLPQPLQVGVANGQYPVEGADVTFTITGGSGSLQGADQTGPAVIVPTTNGIAACTWQLDQTNADQQVEAKLADGTHLPIRFSAGLLTTASAEPGFHVTDIRLLRPDQPLLHDSELLPDELATGIRIVCDDIIEPRAIQDKPTVLVTLDLPFPFNTADRQLWGSEVIGFQPLILAANVSADNNSIFWAPTPETQRWLVARLLQMMVELQRGNRVLAHLTLKGNFISSEKNRRQLLDGDTFALPFRDTNQQSLDLPSGDGRRGGDFELWFWLVRERGGRPQINVGLITNGVNSNEQARLALSLALERPAVKRALPAEYQVTESPFDAPQARAIFQELHRTKATINALVVEELADVGRIIADMLQTNLTGDGVTVNVVINTVPRTELAATVERLLGIAGRQPLGLVIGDSNDAAELARLFPNNFDGSLIAI